jgi:regulatory protein
LDAEIEKAIKEKCMKLLALREHSQRELINKLLVKGYPRNVIENIVEQLAEQGWQNDQRFAESYTRRRVMKGYGPIRIQYELQQIGVEDFCINAVMKEAEKNWSEILKELYLRKYCDDKSLTRREWAKRNRFLQQRGFSNEMIMNLFKQLAIKFD